MLAITNYNKVTVCLERPLLGHIPGNHKGLLFDGLQPGEGGQHGGERRREIHGAPAAAARPPKAVEGQMAAACLSPDFHPHQLRPGYPAGGRQGGGSGNPVNPTNRARRRRAPGQRLSFLNLAGWNAHDTQHVHCEKEAWKLWQEQSLRGFSPFPSP